MLPPGAAVELINRMQQIAAALTQAGVLRQNPPPTTAGAPQTRKLNGAFRNDIKKSLYMRCGWRGGLL